jgi:hypothetical protein
MIPSLFNSPENPNAWSRYSFSHFSSHRRIILALGQQKNVNLTLYDLDPINFDDWPNWLDRNQQAHNDFNSALGLQSGDLVTVDFRNDAQIRSWIYVHAREHEAAERALKIGG